LGIIAKFWEDFLKIFGSPGRGILGDLHKILVISLAILEYHIRIIAVPQGSRESNERS